MAKRIFIEWRDTKPSIYKQYLDMMERSTLLQTFEYAYALRQTQLMASKIGIITEGEKDSEPEDREEIGFFHLHEASTVFTLFHALSIDRGPLWIEGRGTWDDMGNFSEALNRIYPARFGRLRRYMPEANDNFTGRQMIERQFWIYRKEVPHYETIWVELENELDDIRAGMEKNWRNALSKSEKQGLDFKIDHGKYRSQFVKKYAADRLERGYPSPSPRFMDVLMKTAGDIGTLRTFIAYKNDQVVASIAIFLHGNSATYQAGWTTDAGREHNAHHFLIWEAIKYLKENDILHFDLGGVNSKTAKGVTQFKEGIGGEKTKLVGQFG